MPRVIPTLTVLFLASISRADDWPQFLGPNRDGVWKETGLIETFPAGGPPVKWRTPIGIGYAGPAVANGKVYLLDQVLAGGEKLPASGFNRVKLGGSERVVCLDQKTGDLLWKHEYPCTYTINYAAGPRCTPTVDGDRVYALGAMSDLHCLDANTGKVLWSKNFIKDYEAPTPVWGFACHPLVDGDKLICIAGGTNDRLVIAFDKKTGKELWTSQSCQGDFGYCPPVIYEFGGRRQLIAWHARAVAGLDPDTGKRIWAVPTEVKTSLNVAMPRKVGDDGLFLTTFYNGSTFLKVTATGAEVVWKSKAKGEMANQTTDLSSIISTAFVDGDTVYGVCSYGELRGLKARTGERLWSTMKATRGNRTSAKVAAKEEPDQSERWSCAFLTRQADRYWLFNEQGDLIIAKLSPAGYEELSRANVIKPTNGLAGQNRLVVWSPPAFAGKCVFVRNDEEVVCVGLGK
jgi:outer membrane protein assembly factor BamB